MFILIILEGSAVSACENCSRWQEALAVLCRSFSATRLGLPGVGSTSHGQFSELGSLLESF